MAKEWPRGEWVDGLCVGVGQKLVTESLIPRPQRALVELERLNEGLDLSLTLELLPRRFTPIPEERVWDLIVGVHGPLEGNLAGVLREVFGGARKPLGGRLLRFGVALGVGTEMGFLSLFHRGREIVYQLEVYYNLHPDIVQRMGERGLRSYADQGVRVLMENGWYDPGLRLAYDPETIRCFKEERGIGMTLDVAHAFQAAQPLGQQPDIYLREMWEKLDPSVVHFSDRGERDHLPIGVGNYTDLLKEFVTEMKKKPGLVVILEIEPEFHRLGREGVIGDCLEFLS